MYWLDINDLEPPTNGIPILVYFWDPKISDQGPYFIVEYHGNNQWTVLNDTRPDPSDYVDFFPIYWMHLPPDPYYRRRG